MMNDHVPPHDLEIEKSILSGCLYDRETLEEFSSQIKPSDFYHQKHSLIYDTTLALLNRNDPTDLVAVASELAARGQTEKVDRSYLAALIDSPPPTDAGFYAMRLRELAILRELVKAGNAIFKIGLDVQNPADEALNRAQAMILAIESDRGKDPTSKIGELVIAAADRYEALQKRGGGVTGIASGYRDLDRVLCGFQCTDLIILGARPSIGKSALAQNIAYNVGKQGIGSLLFSLEMSREQITDRLVSVVSGVNSHKFRSGYFARDDWEKIVAASDRLHNCPIYFDDAAALHYQDLRRRARREVKQHGVKLIFVDYLQLMRGDRGGRRDEEISSISQNLKAMAKELRVPVIALSQLNRQVEARDEKRPKLSDLRESGSIEQDADVVLLMYRDEVYKKETTHPGIAEIEIAKNRNGPTGRVLLKWHHATTRFSNLETEERK